MPLVIGLTGGIGSGKSSVAKLFEQRDITVVDADVIAHQLTSLGQPALQEIYKRFGTEYGHRDGSLDRAKLRALIFTNATARIQLEQILHPMIQREIKARIAAAVSLYVVAVIPLMLETQTYQEIVDRVIVVDCDEEQQIQRTMQRSGLSEKEVRAIMASQLSREERLRFADDVILNNGNMEGLNSQVAALHNKYLDIASKRELG